MRREDFTAGQTVALLLVGDAARRAPTPEKMVQTGTVVTVGRKYLTVKK